MASTRRTRAEQGPEGPAGPAGPTGPGWAPGVRARPSRAFDTNFQPHATKATLCTYTVAIDTTVTSTGGGDEDDGSVVLWVHSSSPATDGVAVASCELFHRSTSALSTVTGRVVTVSALSAVVPAGYWVQVKKNTNSGGPSFILVDPSDELEIS